MAFQKKCNSLSLSMLFILLIALSTQTLRLNLQAQDSIALQQILEAMIINPQEYKQPFPKTVGEGVVQ